MFTVAEHGAADVAHAQTVHQQRARGHVVAYLHGAVGDQHLIADVGNDDVGGRHAHAHRELGVLFLMSVLAVDGHEELGLYERMDKLELVLISVSGNVDFGERFVYDAATVTIQVVYYVIHHALVAGYGRCGYDDGVVVTQLDLGHFVASHARERAERLALTARGDDDEVLVLHLLYLVDVHHHVVGITQLANARCGRGYVYHAPTAERHLALVLDRKVYDLLYAVDVGRERRYEYAALGVVREYVVEGRAHGGLAHGRARALDVGALGEEKQHSAVAYLGYALEIYDVAVHGRVVHLEVARVEHDARGGRDGERATARDGVRHIDELHLETAKLHRAARLDDIELSVFQLMLSQLSFHQRERDLRTVNRYVQVFENIRQRADMVLVPVRQYYASHAVFVGEQIGRVGYDEVNARHVTVRKTRAAIYHDYVAREFQSSHVFAYLPDTAQKDDLQRRRIGS